MSDEFSFAPISKKEKAEYDQHRRETAERIKASTERAIVCLTSDSFREFKEEYQRGERALVDIGIELSIANPLHYAVAAHTIFSQLKILRILLAGVEKAALKGRR